MTSVTAYVVAPGISATFIADQAGCFLSGLKESKYLGQPLPIPAELQGRRFATCDQAVESVREFFRSRAE